ncbi:MAG: glycoside hydrolase family 28 protein [Clostridia bacterium]|nr:glycoside hydrolase family 28 protein [Clostridia bacterium]
MIKITNFMVPPAAQTETSIAFVWDKVRGNISEYRVYIDGKLHGASKNTDYTASGLKSGREYEAFVCAVLQDGKVIKSECIKAATSPQAEIFDITDFGAVGDGKTLNTKAIQKAIDACSFGGKVYVPKGIFLTGAIFLKSNMTLYIEEGGLLLGSCNTEDYPIMKYRFEGIEQPCYASLINTKICKGERLQNISICGLGKIDANGEKLRTREVSEKKGERARAICIRNTDNIYINDITVKQSPAWCVHLIYCNNVSVNNIKIYTKGEEDGSRLYGICNGDGLNPDSTSNVYIFNSMIASQDDCIAIKSGRDEEGRKIGIPSENIVISNCTFKSGFGVAIGSEMSGGVRNVRVMDCTFDNVYSIASIKAPRGRGGTIENISYEDITLKNFSTEHKDCKWFRGAVYIDQFYSHDEFDTHKAEDVNEGTPVIKNISFKNIRLETSAGNAIYLTGLPESPLENIRFENIEAVGKYGFKASNIEGLVLDNVSIVSKETE